MKLHHSPAACSLAVHIALREAGLPFDLARVDLCRHRLADGSGLRPDLPGPIAALATRRPIDHIGKRSEVVVVLVEPGSWFVAREDPTRLGLSVS
ncbi:MAG TPA: hypothetical protein VM899_17400 [Rubellimicrobium sp.]|nr:hypothetical protein [Rubellimicrobium sp.]